MQYALTGIVEPVALHVRVSVHTSARCTPLAGALLCSTDAAVSGFCQGFCQVSVVDRVEPVALHVLCRKRHLLLCPPVRCWHFSELVA